MHQYSSTHFLLFIGYEWYRNQRKLNDLQGQITILKEGSFRVQRLEKSLQEATNMIQNQQQQLEAQNKVAAMHAEISSAAVSNAAADSEVFRAYT